MRAKQVRVINESNEGSYRGSVTQIIKTYKKRVSCEWSLAITPQIIFWS